MSQRHFRWKDIRKTPDRLNALLQPKKEVPAKFAPSKDRSHSVDVLFENSRSRLHTSAEIQAMNISRDQSVKERLIGKESTMKKQDREMSEKKLALSKFPTIELGNRMSTLTGGETNHFFHQSNTVVAELKKQFWAFKQNVLRELDRQKELIQKFMKEIVLTMELECDKMGRNARMECASLEESVGNKVKSLQQWKGELKNVQMASTADQGSFKAQKTVKYSTSPTKFNRKEQEDKAKVLPPPKAQTDVSNFLSNIAKLKTSFNQIEKLLSDTGKPLSKSIKT